MQEKKRQKRFYPDYLAEVIVSMLVAFEIMLIAALLFPPAIGRQIDFTRQFEPRPEWYFLWLFELVGYFPGDWAVIGIVVIPLLYVCAFLFIPYIDRGDKGPLKATIVGISLLVIFIALTLISVLK